jgi:CDP-6-deoxy-D-xylo-4-hexulose-3-dehydrase
MFDSMVLDRDYRVIGDLPNTDKIMRDGFWIGVYPGMSNEAILYMIETIRVFAQKER